MNSIAKSLFDSVSIRRLQKINSYTILRAPSERDEKNSVLLIKQETWNGTGWLTGCTGSAPHSPLCITKSCSISWLTKQGSWCTGLCSRNTWEKICLNPTEGRRTLSQQTRQTSQILKQGGTGLLCVSHVVHFHCTIHKRHTNISLIT